MVEILGLMVEPGTKMSKGLTFVLGDCVEVVRLFLLVFVFMFEVVFIFVVVLVGISSYVEASLSSTLFSFCN